MDGQFVQRWGKKFRVLTLALIFSGALNIGLMAALVFQRLETKEGGLSISPMAHGSTHKQETTNSQILESMAKLSFRELVSFLTNKDLVEEGYTKRDLALAALVAHHHFHLEKALAGSSLQKRTLLENVDVFPSLGDEQFDAVIRYAYEEKWPLTTEGLVFFLQKQTPFEESLAQAFMVTPEFHALQVLFQKTGSPLEGAQLVQLVREGNWDILARFAQEQTQMLDLSVEKRRRLLLSYLASHSPTAAQLLLKTDFGFALKKLDDRGILDLLQLLREKSEEAAHFCVELLRSPRSDAVWQSAAICLYSYTGEPIPASVDPKGALAHFAPSAVPQPVLVPTLSHVVKEGESLWKIARQYKLKVDELVRLNGLDKDKLHPGMVLKLPQGTGSEPPR